MYKILRSYIPKLCKKKKKSQNPEILKQLSQVETVRQTQIAVKRTNVDRRENVSTPASLPVQAE